MTDTWMFLIREPDWDSDAYTPEALDGADRTQFNDDMAGHQRFQTAVADLGAKLVGGDALSNAKYGATVTPGKDGAEEVWSDAPLTDTGEVITGFYAVECDEDTARKLAPMVPTHGHIEMRRVHRFE